MGSGRRNGGFAADFFAFRVPALPFDVLTEWAEGIEAPSCAPGVLAGWRSSATENGCAIA